jgi:hypothetical protein
MFNLHFLRQIGGFDNRLPALQDYELVIRAINNNAKISGIAIPLVKYMPSNNGNISNSYVKFFIASKIILSKTYFFSKPLLFMGLSRIFVQKTIKSKEFRESILKGRGKTWTLS